MKGRFDFFALEDAEEKCHDTDEECGDEDEQETEEWGWVDER